MTTVPRFAVVGHPNKGKSSIVATLTHQDSIDISRLSGTTKEAQTFSFQVDGETVYELVDTPGFQRPRQALQWLLERGADASQRQQAVREFIQQHQGNAARYLDEVELLGPIIKGAGIIYVVDGSLPYSPEYEAEMEILRWTGQPRMALINPIASEQFVDEWRQALGQFFSVVRVFNPMTANHEKQLTTLSAFAELKDEWRPAITIGLELMRMHFAKQRLQAAQIITSQLTEMIGHQSALPLDERVGLELTKKLLRENYQRHLAASEQKMRKQLAELFAHHSLTWQSQDLLLDYPELFDQGHWYFFGLTKQRLLTLAASVGFVTGAAIDASVGAASFMSGAVAGTLLSGAATLFASQNPERIKVRGLPVGGKQVTAGPIKNLQLLYVLLGRAVHYSSCLLRQTHANRNELMLQDNQMDGLLTNLEKGKQVRLTLLLQKSRKELSENQRHELTDLIAGMLTAIDATENVASSG